MLNLTISMIMSLMIPTVIMIMASIMYKKTIHDREKSSPFECGFDPKSSSRMPFSIQFFLIAVIFLIFDIEIALILPIIVTMKSSNLTIWTITTMSFLMLLLLGLYYEWNQGSLQWAK